MIVNIKHLSVTAAALILMAAAGCGGKPGVDAKMATEGGPRQTREIDAEEHVQIVMGWLEKAEPDKETNQKIPMKFLSLMAQGAAAEPALPLLGKFRDEWEDENVRNSAAKAIAAIEKVIEEEKQQ